MSGTKDTPARRYFQSRAISAQVAFDVGVRPGANPNELQFPNGRRRLLDSGKVLQAKGKPLAGWWLTDRGDWTTALVCEGESDALAAATALRSSPAQADLRDLPVLCVPGTGYPVERLREDVSGLATVLLAFDPDEAGWSYASIAAGAMADAGIRPIVVEVPEPDLADYLADSLRFDQLHDEDFGCGPEWFASLLIDSEADAPTMADWRRAREIESLRGRLAELEAA